MADPAALIPAGFIAGYLASLILGNISGSSGRRVGGFGGHSSGGFGGGGGGLVAVVASAEAVAVLAAAVPQEVGKMMTRQKHWLKNFSQLPNNSKSPKLSRKRNAPPLVKLSR